MSNSTLLIKNARPTVTCFDTFNCKLALVFGRFGGEALRYF